LVGNKGVSPLSLKVEGSGPFVIDEKQADQRYDGKDDPLSQHKCRSFSCAGEKFSSLAEPVAFVESTEGPKFS
jgi:hypothetical protein